MDSNNNLAGTVTVMDGATATQVPVVRITLLWNDWNILFLECAHEQIQVPEKMMELARSAGVDLSQHVSVAPPEVTEPSIVLPDGSVVQLPKGGQPDTAPR